MSNPDRGPRLGRGLAALMGDQGAETAAGGSRYLAIDLLEQNPFQPRTTIDPASLGELTDSIRTSGILQPLLARRHPSIEGRFQLIAGERRWRAAQAAGLHDVPVLIRDMSDAEAMAAALVENLQRQDLNAIEEAEGFRRLMHEFSMTQEQLGAAVGKSRSHVANTLRLLNLPSGVRAKVSNGLLSAGHARALLGHDDPEAGAATVIGRGLNVRQTEALAADRRLPPAASRKIVDPETAALERELSARLGLRVEIGFNGAHGTVKLHYASLDQLDGIVTLLNG